ncbi:MAG: WG repeat-containing protein, partial [Clostridia bacterium]|nr:WG repeat-containing protein [Clostridia bacterium]
VTASRYIVSEYAEPLYRNSENSKGYLYFDEGLVRVRKLERDYTFRNLIYSDSDVLLYPDGSEFKIPSGFTLVSYSEGVLVLKGNDGKYGYYHKNGYWIAQPIYTEIRPFSEGLGVIGFLGGKKGVIDINGNIVIPFAYEYITAPSDGVLTLYSYEKGWKILVKMEK